MALKRGLQLVSASHDHEDNSGFINLKLLRLHFPEQMKIIGIIVFDRHVIGEEFRRYYAMVYTEEKLRDNTFRYVRHFLRGTPTKFFTAGNRKEFWKMDWNFDQTNQFCSDVGGKVWATTNLYEYPFKDDCISFKFIEFYDTKHKILEMVFENSSDAFEIRGENKDNSLRRNTFLMNCEALPNDPLSEPLSDCRENRKLDRNYTGDISFVDQSILPMGSSQKSSSQLFWVIKRHLI